MLSFQRPLSVPFLIRTSHQAGSASHPIGLIQQGGVDKKCGQAVPIGHLSISLHFLPLTSFYLFSCSSYFCPVFPVFPRLIFCGKSKRRRVHCTLTVVVTPGATGCPPLVSSPTTLHLATIPTRCHLLLHLLFFTLFNRPKGSRQKKPE